MLELKLTQACLITCSGDLCGSGSGLRDYGDPMQGSKM